MPHDPALVQETLSWFHKALRDLEAAEYEMTAKPPFLEDVLFHSQQAAEKGLKGFLTWHGKTFRKTHDLKEIGWECLKIKPSLKTLIREAAPLTDYAWKYRYPGDDFEPTLLEAKEALAKAWDLHRALLQGLPSSVHPGPKKKRKYSRYSDNPRRR